MRSALLTIFTWALSYACILLPLPYTSASTILTDASINMQGKNNGTKRNKQNQQQRRAQEGMPLPPLTTDSPGDATTVEYSPIYNTRMKACPGYAAEGLRGYTTLNDLRYDLQLYFYDMNGYSYHRTAADIAAELLTESPTGHPSASPSLSFPPTVAKSDVPSSMPSVTPSTLEPTDEPTSSVRLPKEPTKSPSPTMLPKFAGVTSPTSSLNNSADNLMVTIPEGALGEVGSSMGEEVSSGEVIFFGGETNPADVLVDGEGTTFAPTGPIPSLRTGSPSRTPTMKPMELDENQLALDEGGGVRKRIRGVNDEADNDRRRLQEAGIMTVATIPSTTTVASKEFVEVMNNVGIAEVDELVTGADGGESLIPVSLSADESATSTQQKGGMHFHICPDTNFQFNSIFVAQLKFLPLVLESPVQTPLTLACLKEQTCTFNGGDYHIVVNNNGLEEDSLGESSIDQLHSTITLRGIVFQQAEEASIVMNDPRGKIVIDKCKWENNEGEAIVVDGKYTGKFSSVNKETQYYGEDDFMLPEGKENPFASTDPTVPVSTTQTPLAFLFGSTQMVSSTQVNFVATTEAPEAPAVATTEMAEGGRSMEEIGSASPKSLILIRQSTFTGNKGKATIAVDSFPENEGQESGSASTGSIHLEVDKSTFSFERVGTSVIVTSGAKVSLTGSLFDKNTADSTIKTNSGTISITDTEFTNNAVTGGDGIVVVDTASKVGDTNCVSGDDGVIATAPISSKQGDSDLCEGVAVGGSCRPFGQVCDPNAIPVPLVSDSEPLGGSDVGEDSGILEGSDLEGDSAMLEGDDQVPIMGDPQPEVITDCHDNWNDLQYAVENRIVDGIAVLSHIGSLYFKVCPNSTLYADSGPIVIDYDYVTVQCGNNGLKSDNCQILGGLTHFHIVGSSTDIKLAGLRMTSSTGSSIIAAGTNDAKLQISDCEWMSNRGASAILIHSNATAYVSNVTETLDIASMLNSSEAGMSVEMTGVGFMQNVLTYGTVVNVGGSLSIDKGRFDGNEISVGDIAVMKSGELFIRNSCFDESASMVPGTIFIDETSFLQANVNTFGFDNTDGGFRDGSICTDIFVAAVGSDCLSGSTCDGTCNNFTSITCPLDVTSLPTIIPGGSDEAVGGGINAADTPGTEYVRNKNPSAKASIVPVVVAVLVCSFIVFGLFFIIFKRRRKKPASEPEFQGVLNEDDDNI